MTFKQPFETIASIKTASAKFRQKDDLLETRRRLIMAAGEVFAEVGFRQARVRDICRRAGANVAAINYHFGNKKKLYMAVVQFAHGCAMDKYPPDMGVNEGSRPEECLHAFIRSFIARICDRGQLAWHGKLMSREMMEPTFALQKLVDTSIRPNAERLGQIIGRILGKSASPMMVRRCAQSVIAQCLFHHQARPLLDRLYPDQTYEPADVEELAAHITRFSLAALKALRKPASKGGRR